MEALFRVGSVFEISSVGRVIVGEILEGTVRAGMIVTLNTGISRLGRVSSVELTTEGTVGLVLTEAPDLKALQVQVPLGSLLHLEST